MAARRPKLHSDPGAYLVKAFGGQMGSVAVNGPSSPLPLPANAITVTQIQALETWQAAHDSGGGVNTSAGITSIVSSPSQSGAAREFDTNYTNSGDERYWAVFASDPAATNFVYDVWIYIASPADGIANIELDMNQVLANGQTDIYGFQCDGYSGTWDYTANTGTPKLPNDTWMHATASCNPRAWATDVWHHLQVAYSRDDAGNVTYQSVWLDGARQDIGATVPSAFALGWGSVLLTNFQVDGSGLSGTSTVYLDNLTISRW